MTRKEWREQWINYRRVKRSKITFRNYMKLIEMAIAKEVYKNG